MISFFANYGYYAQAAWMRDREAHKPRGTMYAHWMQNIHRQVKQTLEDTGGLMKKYYDRNVIEEPSIGVGDRVMLNANNMCTKYPWQKLSPKFYGLFKVLEWKGNRAYKLEILPPWKMHPVFHVSLLQP